MKKSKFLKKSLAMLLALMLVVAMIPLSASAASSEGPSLIYVDDNTVALPEAEVDVPTGEKSVDMRLNSDLGGNYELRVLAAADTQLSDKKLTTKNQGVLLDDYMDSNKEIHLQLYKQVGNSNNWETVEGCAYTVTVNFTTASTTTDVKFVENVKGVYSATVDTENKIVSVVLARHVDADGKGQESLGAEMKMKALDNAKINGGAANGTVTVDADNNDTFTVTSESGNNVAKYTVKVTSYLEALSEFTVTGTDGEKYSATPVDANLDDVPDTIVVNLPESAIYDKTTDSSFANPQLAVSYVAEGDVTSNVEVWDTAKKLGNVKSDGSGDKITFTGLGTGDQEFEGKVVVNRLPETVATNGAYNGAVQTYDLLVQLEKDTSTEITYVKVNNTLGEVDAEAGTLTASVPTVDNIAGKDADVVIKTPATVQSVTIDSKTVNPTLDENNSAVKVWTFTGKNDINVSKQQIVDVVAEDGTKQTYTLNVTTDTNTTDATITAIWIKDGSGNTYKADVTTSEDDLLVKVPFMTTDVRDWTIFVTPSSHTYVTYSSNKQLVNGETKLSDIKNSLGPIDADKTWEIEVTANNKNNAEIKKNYTLTIDLESPKDGKTLSDLDFSATAQETDKLIALKSVKDVNTFDAQIDTHTNGSTNVTNLNLKVPVSLTDKNDLGLDYSNVVTNFATKDGGVAYTATQTGNTYYLNELKAINPSNSADVYGTKLEDGDIIVVLPEKSARVVKMTAGNSAGTPIAVKDVEEQGTVYQVNINVKPGDNKSQLLTFKVGNTTLKVEGNKITGELPFSATTELNSSKQFDDYAAATFVEFTTSPYAQLFDNYSAGNSTNGVKYFSNGDIEGDGLVDDIDNWDNADIKDGYIGLNNYKLAFVRNADHTVTVYRVDDVKEESARLDSKGNGYMIVRAENRLDSKTPSSSRYDFELTWAAPCEEADIETFTLGGYTGVINNDADNGRTITVTVPYDTDVTGLVAEFTASSGATVKLGSTSGMDFVSGVTSANYSNPVQLWITSEDGDTTRMYTVTVEEGISFSDVNPGDWFYDNVMDAAENGYISGMGDGTFNPTGATTRAQFASMIANAMGYEANPDAKSAFPDVADDFWGKAAINFCVENGILSGYDDGTFQPNKAITRQEAASILRNAFELTETTDELFPDDSAIAGWAKESVYLVKAAELMKGDAGTGNFRPTSTITRAEAASILMNAKYAGVID